MKFKIIYTGEESFFQYYKIKGKKTLPLSAYIEMIRVAGCKVNNGEINVIQNFKWNLPIIIEKDPLVLYIELWEQKEGFSFEFYQENDAFHKTIYAQGNLLNVSRVFILYFKYKISHGQGLLPKRNMSSMCYH
jgi:polyketide synthase PksN